MKFEEIFRTKIMSSVEVEMLNGTENALRYIKLQDNETIVKVEQKKSGALYIKIKETIKLYEAEDLKDYLKGLNELSKKHSLYIDSTEELCLMNTKGQIVSYDIWFNSSKKKYEV